MKYRNYKRSFRNGVANALYFANPGIEEGINYIGRRRFYRVKNKIQKNETNQI